MKPRAHLAVVNARLATLAGFSDKPQRGCDLGRLGLVDNGAVAMAYDKILAVGPLDQVAGAVDLSAARVLDARGRLVTPGLVDPHTHVVHVGSREREYTMRLQGSPISRSTKPGGILSSVNSVRRLHWPIWWPRRKEPAADVGLWCNHCRGQERLWSGFGIRNKDA